MSTLTRTFVLLLYLTASSLAVSDCNDGSFLSKQYSEISSEYSEDSLADYLNKLQALRQNVDEDLTNINCRYWLGVLDFEMAKTLSLLDRYDEAFVYVERSINHRVNVFDEGKRSTNPI